MIWIDPFVVTVVLTGIIFVIAAGWMERRPPKTINHLYGYRTPASMASQERWDFAQKASAIRMRFWGWVMVACGACVVVSNAVFGDMHPGISIPLSLGVVISCCVLLLTGTERDLKKHFGPLRQT